MKPDPIPDGRTAKETLHAINASLDQLHECMEGRLDSVEQAIAELVAAKKAERERIVKDLQQERHRARNEETKLQAQIALGVQAMGEVQAITKDHYDVAQEWRAAAGIKIDTLTAKLGADKPVATVAGMSQRKLAIWAGSIAALAAAGPTIVREIAVLGHGAASVFISIGAIR